MTRTTYCNKTISNCVLCSTNCPSLAVLHRMTKKIKGFGRHRPADGKPFLYFKFSKAILFLVEDRHHHHHYHYHHHFFWLEAATVLLSYEERIFLFLFPRPFYRRKSVKKKSQIIIYFKNTKKYLQIILQKGEGPQQNIC